MRTRVGPGNHALDGVQIPPSEGSILGERRAHCKYRVFLPWAVQEQLNRSIFRLDCGLRWAEGSSSSVVFAMWCQCAHKGRHIGATWEYNWTIRVPMRSMSNYFDHLLVLLTTVAVFVIDINDKNWHIALKLSRRRVIWSHLSWNWTVLHSLVPSDMKSPPLF